MARQFYALNGEVPIRITPFHYMRPPTLVHYLRTIGYTAWIEDTYGNQIEETALKVAIKLGTLPNDSNRLLGIQDRGKCGSSARGSENSSVTRLG